MRAILLFSAVMHVAALALVVAYGAEIWRRRWGRPEPSFQSAVWSATRFGLAVLAGVTVILCFGPFGFRRALVAGIVAGVVGMISLLLCAGARPFRMLMPGETLSPAARTNGRVFLAVFAALQLVAFSFLIYAATTVPPHS